jgi:hypothetical protein
MNMKRAKFWRNLLVFSALSGTASQVQAQEGVSRLGPGKSSLPSEAPGAAGLSAPEGYVPLTPSPYMPLDPGYNFQRPMPPSLPPAYDTLQNSRRDAFGPRFDIGQFLGNRLGVNNTDTNFNFLLPYLLGSGEDVLFIDGRGLVTDQGRGGASAGIGYRSFDANHNRIYGISGWVDYDQGHARTYQQAGISFESLGTWMDFRVNGYLPFGTESNLLGRSLIGSPFFSGSNLLINQRSVNESAYHGVDAEVGGPLPVLGRYGVSGYVGGYWLDSRTDVAAAGPRVRFEANITDNFRVNVTASDDKVFGTNAWVNLNFTLPDGRPRRWFRPTEVEDRLLMTTNRSYRVQTHTSVDITPTPVLLAPPGTPNLAQGSAGTPVTVVFVDPDRLTNGDGTFERPFNTLQGFANTPSTTLIVVDGSAANRAVNGSITLFGDQKLVSTSILAAGGVNLHTNLGLITLPGLNGFGDATPVSPIFSNPAGGTLVTLAGANTEVAGITFDGSTANAAIPHATAISGTNLVDFNIHHNTFQNYRNAVVLNNATGVGLFQANTLVGTPGTSIDGFRLANSGTGLLDLFVNTSTPLAGSTLAAQGNNISGNDGAGVSITARNRAVINAHIEGNNISNNGNGVIVDAAATRSVINLSVANNIFDGNRGEDRNRNGILDPGEDLNGDGVLNTGNGVLLMANASTINAAQLGEDTNGNGRLDLSEDTNGNGILDLSEDLNGNGVLDVSEDKNGNGVLDPGEDKNGNGVLDIPTEDTNGNGVLDAGEDLNGNGTIDVIVEDKNGNGVLDPSEDKNGNGLLDRSEDTNRNGRLDGGFLITGNQFTRNTGDGLSVVSTNNAIVNLITIRNNFGNLSDHSTGNLGRGLSITADSGVVNANVGFITTEDVNFNGVLDPGEDKNGNGVLDSANPLDANNFVANHAGGMLVNLTGSAVGNIVTLNNTIIGQGGGSLTEDRNGNGVLDSEDLNNNGRLDLGEDANNNGILDTEDLNNNGLLDSSLFLVGGGNGTSNGLPFSFVNASPLGAGDITNLVWNIAPAGLEFNTAGLGSGAFSAINGTSLSTGLTSVNGTTTAFTVTDQATALNLSFNNFQSVNGVLDMGEDVLLNGTPPGTTNGKLDYGEDLAKHLDFNIGTATAGGANTALTGNQFIGSTVTATFASGQVLTGTLQAVPNDPTAAQFVVNANGNNSGSGPGVEMRVSQTAVLNNPTLIGNNIQFHGGAGFLAQATEDGRINNLHLQNNTIQNNGSAANAGGINLSTVAASSAQITGSIRDNIVRSNSGPGVLVTADTGVIDLAQINNNTFSSNILNDTTGSNTTAISLNTLNNGAITTRITNNLMDGSTGDGFIANANSGTITLNQFTANSLTNSGGNGILFNATNNGTINLPATEDVNGNFILDEGEDVNGNGFFDLGMFMNDVSSSAGNGLFVTGTGGTFHLGRIAGLTSNRSAVGQGGIVIDVTDSVVTGQFVGNTLIGSAANTNVGPGFSLTATSGTFDVSVGGPNDADRNVIQNNSGAGVSIIAQNAAQGTFLVQNNLITGTLNGSEDVNGNGILDISEDSNGNGRLDQGEDSNGNGVLDLSEDRNGNGILDVGTGFGGEGIHIGTGNMSSFSLATAELLGSSVIGNTLQNNISHGIGIDLREETTLRDLTISGNTISSNFGSGINFVRHDNAVVENTRIFQNVIDFNGEDLNLNGVLDPGEDLNTNQQLDGDGISIAGFEGGRTILGFDLFENQITRNFQNGIHLNVAADARLNVDITHNIIDNNGTTSTAALANFASGNGILTTENFGAATDKREIGGDWNANRITNNAARGIRLDGTATNIFNEIADTFTANNLTISGNLIDSSGFDGILVNGPGRMTIDSNTITNNGASAGLAASVTAATTAGSDLGNGIAIRSVLLDQNGNVAAQTLPPESTNTPGSQLEPRAAGPKYVEVLRNEIRGNANDGLEIRHANNPSGLHDAELHPGFFPLTVIAQGNVIELNRGRGVDILNQGGSRSPENVDLFTTETGASTTVNPPSSTVPRTSNQFSPTDSTVRLIDNRISSNDKEGIYVVNTASLAQGQSGNTPVPANSEDPSRGLSSAAANPEAVPRLALEVDHNLIIKNGQRLDVDPVTGAPIDTITSGGLVIRVGTSDANVVQEESPFLQNGANFVDFASAPGGTTAALFGETGYRNADEIIQASGRNFGQIGFFNRLQPGGVVAKVTNNGLDSMGRRDTSTGFEGNFGSDVYIESFASAAAGIVNPSIARLDMIFENNSGDSLDVTNFGAFFGAAGNRQNGQRLAGSTPLPGLPPTVTLPIFGRVVGVHNTTITAYVDSSAAPGLQPSPTTFQVADLDDVVFPNQTQLDDLANIYANHELEFRGSGVSPILPPDLTVNITNSTGLLPSGGVPAFQDQRLTLNPAPTTLPNLGDPVQIELSTRTFFDVALFQPGVDPRDPNAVPLTFTQLQQLGLTSNVLSPANAQGNIDVRFLDEFDYSRDGSDDAFDDQLQPTAGLTARLVNNWILDGGQSPALQGNPSPFHERNNQIVDADNNNPGFGGGPVASKSAQFLNANQTSNTTLQVQALPTAPRDGNLFVLTNVRAGAGESAFRVSGATVAAQASMGINVNTNQFTSKNLGFDDAVSLGSQNPNSSESPFEWGALPNANRDRIQQQFFPTRAPLGAAPQSYKDFRFPRIVFP